MRKKIHKYKIIIYVFDLEYINESTPYANILICMYECGTVGVSMSVRGSYSKGNP